MKRNRQFMSIFLSLIFLVLPTDRVSGRFVAVPAGAKNGMTRNIVVAQDRADEDVNNDKVIYLTFDDGPDPHWTPTILKILDKYGAGATFYMIGRNASTFPDIVRLIAEHKQNIAVHGYNHTDLGSVDYTTFYLEVHDTEQVILDALRGEPNLEGQYARCLRPPYGQASNMTYQYAYQMGYAISMWTIDTIDWQQPDPTVMLSILLSGLEPGKVILMHDGGEQREQTIAGLQLILHELIMQGYKIKPYCTSSGQAITNP
jgi:peptidoglycan/xylan/chitin deacetylase (PgdA/CDA1 family)